MRATVGVHPTESTAEMRRRALLPPTDADSLSKRLLDITTQGMSDNTVVAVGECGLDRERTHYAAWDAQLDVFRAHFAVTRATGLPMFIHSRGCGAETVAELAQAKERGDLPGGGVVHSFDGSVDDMRRLVELGLFIGVNGCSLKTPENLDVVRQIPLSSLVLESDAPWCSLRPTSAAMRIPGLTLEPWTGCTEVKEVKRLTDPGLGVAVRGRNEPRAVLHVCQVVAALRGDPVSVVADATTANAKRLFPTLLLKCAGR